jgi:uncharacterized membrane protein YsdA (DUF1294 family)
VKPVNLAALTGWVGTFPQELLHKMDKVNFKWICYEINLVALTG